MSFRLLIFLAMLCSGLAVEAGDPAIDAPHPTPDRPNIVLVLADDAGYGDLSCYGAERIRTPNLDALASQGLRFTQAFAPSATCTPTRYALLTGEYGWRQPPKKTGILDGDAPLCIEPGRTTLASLLRDAGYAAGLVGKWHLGLGDGVTPVDFNGEIKPGPLEVGFTHAFFLPATVDRVPTVFIQDHRVVGLDPSDPIRISYLNKVGNDPTGIERPDLLKYGADRQHACTIVNGISRIGYLSGGNAARWVDEEMSELLVRRSVEFITENRAGPFFLYLGLHDPHVPRMPAPRFRGSSGCGIRGDAIQQMDWVVGELMAALDRLGLSRDTLVIFTSDNGPVLFDGYFDGAVEEANGHRPAGPLRGAKYLVYEGGTRVPFIARWPGKVPAGQVSDQMICLSDLPATAAALVGAKLPPATAPDSLDILPILLGRADAPIRTEVVQHGISGALALRVGSWKYIPPNGDRVPADIGSGANPLDQRFSEARITEPLLFDLARDPGETRNLAAEQPERLREMARRLDQIRSFKGGQ